MTITDNPITDDPTNLAATALIKQYFELKSKHEDHFLFFRVGDFYEMFDKDAQLASRELEITLTSKSDPGFPGGRIPMAGVPVKSYETYVTKLLNKGYSVAICEQVGQVGLSKGPVERSVVRILTPGTIIESHLLPQNENNYLCCLVKGKNVWGLAFTDISCGQFLATQLTENDLIQEIIKINPKEIIIKTYLTTDKDLKIEKAVREIPDFFLNNPKYKITTLHEYAFNEERAKRRIYDYFKVVALDGYGLNHKVAATIACGVILDYLEKTHGQNLPYLPGITSYEIGENLEIDHQTQCTLEILETLRDKKLQGSLLWAIDKTKTAMGARLLRKWLVKPLKNLTKIQLRQSVVEELLNNERLKSGLEDAFNQLNDLERLSVKLAQGNVNPRDLLAIAESLKKLDFLNTIYDEATSAYLKELSTVGEFSSDLANLILTAVAKDAPRELTDGNIFQNGYNENLDELRSLLYGGEKWLSEYQASEIQKTGIKNLKVSFNRVFGYFIEVTNSFKKLVPVNYVRKQTLSNGERYITDELKKYETKILSAKDKSCDLEYNLFIELRNHLKYYGSELLELSHKIATIDVLLAFAIVSKQNNYVKPIVDDSLLIDIKAGRHPVLEAMLPLGTYQPNDLLLAGESSANQLIVLTGPNMSGKSSYLRQTAHIVILAQLGCFVSAKLARIGLVDRIFTRIGASDDVTSGQSTFLVEMSETTQCCILSTSQSLILLDEVGRGTSTYDGVAIAYAVAEYLATAVKARTIFATHYHELNSLSNSYPQIENFQVLVAESGGKIEFLHTVAPGSADKSYGIHVASMAGLPNSIIARAKFLMSKMEKKSGAASILDNKPKNQQESGGLSVIQLTLFDSLN